MNLQAIPFPTAASPHRPPTTVPLSLPTLPIELIDPILATTIAASCHSARYDIDLYQSSITTILNALSCHHLRQTNNVALAKLTWLTDIDLLCARGYPLGMLDWVYSLTCKYPHLYLHWSGRAAVSSSARGDVAVLDWLARVFGRQPIYDPQENVRQASLQGHVHVLEWWSNAVRGLWGERLNRHCHNFMVYEMAGRGQVEALDWWMARGIHMELQMGGLATWALRAGQLRVVKWLERRNWIEYSPQCVEKAAHSGDLETLQYCIDKVMRAPQQPSEALLEEENADMCEDACPYFAAASRNHLHVLEWLLQAKYPVPDHADNLDNIVETCSADTLKWWLDHLCVGLDMAEAVWSGLHLCSGNLDMMQLLFDRYPQAILQHATKEIDVAPSIVRVHDVEHSHVKNLAVLEWWETNILRNCGVPRDEWPVLFDKQYVAEACLTGNTPALDWMFSYDSYYFAIQIVGADVDVRASILEAVGQGGHTTVVEWWLYHRLPFGSEDLSFVVGGAIECGHLDFLERLWARFSSIVQFNCCDNLAPLPVQFALDRALAHGHGQVLEWILDTLKTTFMLGYDCFTYGTKLNDPSHHRPSFQSVLCYSHAVAPRSVRWNCSVSVCFKLIECGKARIIQELVVGGHLLRSEITDEVLGYAASAGAVPFLSWWLQDDERHDHRIRRNPYLVTLLRKSVKVTTKQEHVLSLPALLLH
ncbi:hypothetical protein BCR44DRAFT_54662 [Catenaria anguillulae PL171]|uniref:Ankyrin repeat-containing domain protein n=1 Tax=Catenaria anguillulae PL171 TaxID=765915 RepID=A0A1Y2HC39_9FUNG|nr:hypothetical protein BCR44DRAFT_54662 [Catenaria anguillulae PL171]